MIGRRTKSQVAALIEMFEVDVERLVVIPRKTKRVKHHIAAVQKHILELRTELETAPE